MFAAIDHHAGPSDNWKRETKCQISSSIRNGTVKAFDMLPGGEEMYAVKVDARGKLLGKDVQVQQLLVGRREADATAAVAAGRGRTHVQGENAAWRLSCGAMFYAG